MKLFELTINIDGFMNQRVNMYFRNYDDAVKTLGQAPGFHFDPDKGWDIECIKEVKVFQKNNRLTIKGIPYNPNERDDRGMYIEWAEAGILPINVHGDDGDILYVLKKVLGYKRYMVNAIYGSMTPLSMMQKNDVIFAYSTLRNYIRKIARIQYKRIPRGWNKREFEMECNPVTGLDNDYLEIERYNIN